MTALTFGSLFAGIGGADLACEWAGMECKWQVEIDDFATSVLTRHWPDVPKFRDVRTVGAADLIPVDVIVGGFPCQDISNAGKRVGITGDRSGLWSEFARIIGELRPRYVVVENVAALLGRGLDVVLGDLAEIGYDAEWQIVSAASVGAPHRRERLFVVAHANSAERWPLSEGRDECNGYDAGRNQAPGRFALLGQDGRTRPLAHAERSECERRGIDGVMGNPPATDEGEAWERERLRDTPGHSRSAMANTEGECGQIRQTPGERPGRLAGGDAAMANSNSGGQQGRLQRDGIAQGGLAASCGDDADGCDATLGHSTNVGCKRAGRTWNRRTGFEDSNPVMEHADGKRCAAGIAPAVAGSEGLTAWRCDEDGRLGEPQSGMDGITDGFPNRMVGYRSHGLMWPGWPAGMGPYQYGYEQPRTGGKARKRRLRLKALGNAIVPQQLYPIMATIAAEENR